MTRLAPIALCLSVPAAAHADDCDYTIGADSSTRIAVVGRESGKSHVDVAVLDTAYGELLHRTEIQLCK